MWEKRIKPLANANFAKMSATTFDGRMVAPLREAVNVLRLVKTAELAHIFTIWPDSDLLHNLVNSKQFSLASEIQLTWISFLCRTT
jgi:hypothetical protein